MTRKVLTTGIGFLLFIVPVAACAQTVSLPALPADATLSQLESEVQVLMQILGQLAGGHAQTAAAAATSTTFASTTVTNTTPTMVTTTLATSSASPDPVFSWTQSLPVNFAANGIGPFRGTEARALVFSNGSLYAGIGDWKDPDFDDAKEPGAQILRLDSPSGQWVVDQDFNEPLPGSPGKKLYLAIAALAAFQITKNDAGQAVTPLDTMFASVWSLGAGLDIFQKIGDNGAWTRIRLVGVDTATAGLGSQVRAFTQYTDSVTGQQLILAGASPFGIFDGAYDSGSGTVVWSKTAETGSFSVPLVNAEGKKGATSDRVTSFATCEGKLYASVYDGIIVRTDGANPSWRLIYEQPTGTLPTASSGFRGLTCVPNTHGSGDMLVAVLENDPLDVYDIQVTPPYTGAVEENLSSYASSQLGTTIKYGIGAYNNMVQYPTSNPSCPDELIGLHLNAPDYAQAYQGLYPSATYVARHCDGTYGPIQIIADPSIAPAPGLEATRTMVVSQFPEDPAGTIYAGGYDAHDTPAWNTDWVYRGASSGACPSGTTLQNNFCIVQIPPTTLSVSPATTTAFSSVTFSGNAPGASYTLKYGDGSGALTQACNGSALTCAATTISQMHAYTTAGTYTAHLITASGAATTVVTVAAMPTIATIGTLGTSGTSADWAQFTSTMDIPTYTVDQSTLGNVRPWIGHSNCASCTNTEKEQDIYFPGLTPGDTYEIVVYPTYVSTATNTFAATIASGQATVTSGATITFPTTGYLKGADPWTITFTPQSAAVVINLSGSANGGNNYLYFDQIQLLGVYSGSAATNPTVSAPTLSATPMSTTVGTSVNFTGSAPGPFYTFKYGDGTTPYTVACDTSNCPSATVYQSHTYTAAGTYVVHFITAGGGATTTITVLNPPVTATLTQSLTSTTFSSSKAQSFTISWSSTNATSCTIQKENANGLITDPWATGTSGSQTAVPTVVGTLHWWIDCTGPGGTAHQDIYHSVVSSSAAATTTASTSDQLSSMASVLVAIEAILAQLK